MKRERFIENVSRRTGLATVAQAEAAIYAVLVVLGEELSRSALSQIADDLPQWLKTPLVSRRGQLPDLDPNASFFDKVATIEGVAAGFAREHAAVVLRALEGELSPAARRTLHLDLPAHLHELFAHPDTQVGPVPEAVTRRPSTLAEGRPGSRHPVSESHPRTSHTHSVARTADPHSATKLSEGRTTTQELRDATLATGRPGSSRPLSETGREGEPSE